MSRLSMRARSVVAAIALLLLARVAGAQEVGTLVGVEGAAEIGRGTTWTPATVGAQVQKLDWLRTGSAGGRMSVALIDGSVLNIGEGSNLTLEDVVLDSTGGVVRSLVRLVAGKIRPVVDPSYRERGGSYEIETPTALVGVRGTEFVIAYDPVAEVSDVVGVTGQVEVHSVADRVNRGVMITKQELTLVAKGKLPTPPQEIPDALFRQYLEGLEFIGGGTQEGMTAGNSLLAGNSVLPPDRADVLAGPGLAGISGLTPPPAVRPPLWPLLVAVPGDDWTGPCTTVGCLSQQPPATIRTTGDVGIPF